MQESPARQLATIEIIRRTINNLSDLIDKQIELVSLEVRDNLTSLFRGAGLLIAGLIILFLTGITLLIALILVLSTLIPGWLAALIVAVILAIPGAILTVKGLAKVRVNPLERTRRTIGEELEWAKSHLTSGSK